MQSLLSFWHEISSSSEKKTFMEQVFYKGHRYAAKQVTIGGCKRYSLYNTEGTLLYFVNKEQLEKKSILDVCLETYLKLSGHA
jgi:hypothetical protein